MSQVTADNTAGKTKFLCSCGIRVNLEPHEFPSWIARHSEHYIGQKHELSQIVEANAENLNLQTMKVLEALSKRLGLVDKTKEAEK